MNADVEGDRLEAPAIVEYADDAVGWLTDKQNGVQSNVVSEREIELAVAKPAVHHNGLGVTLARLVSHVVVLVLLGAALLLGQFVWARPPTSAVPTRTFKQHVLLLTPLDQISHSDINQGFLRRQMPPSTVDLPDVPDESLLIGRGGSKLVNAGFVTRGIAPEGSPDPLPRTKVISYSVRYGDTLWTIAQKFSITQDTLWANNDLPSPDMLSIGEQLIVPPVDGLIYKVRRGDTLAGLAKRYRTTVDAIIDYAPNDLSEGNQPLAGQEIIIPGGVKPIPPRRTVSLASAPAGALKGVGSFVMPAGGILTQGFHSGHAAIDIGAPRGTPVYAADAGYVSFAGWHPWGYGYAVEIDHGNGFRTLYAHLSWYKPDLGQSIKRGELIGGVGSTYGSGGWSSGPHLHFEIIRKGAKRNPCVFLPCP